MSQSLIRAATALYAAGHWTASGVSPEVALRQWTTLRDALGLPPGSSTVAHPVPVRPADPTAVRDALRALYTSGRWTAGLDAAREEALWVSAREALGLQPGTATALGLGTPARAGGPRR